MSHMQYTKGSAPVWRTNKNSNIVEKTFASGNAVLIGDIESVILDSIVSRIQPAYIRKVFDSIVVHGTFCTFIIGPNDVTCYIHVNMIFDYNDKGTHQKVIDTVTWKSRNDTNQMFLKCIVIPFESYNEYMMSKVIVSFANIVRMVLSDQNDLIERFSHEKSTEPSLTIESNANDESIDN